MYKNKFLAIIKKDGSPLRETTNQYVHLPFGSEYSIELRNDHPYRRALAKIYIDGTEVVDGGMVVEASKTVNVERFVLGGNLSKGKKFKFVALDKVPGADPKNSENGIVKIEFWLEDMHIVPDIWLDIPKYCKTGSISVGNTSRQLLFDSVVSSYNSSMYVTEPAIDYTPAAGVTTEGSDSNQVFTTTTFGELDNSTYTVIEIQLRNNELTIATDSKIYCTQCGKKIKPTFSFCPNCGKRVEI